MNESLGIKILPNREVKFTQTQINSFWSRVRKSEYCWEWVGSKNKKGYGRFLKGWIAHRASFIIAGNENPGKLYVLHHCDNPACVRPDHLFTGTQLDNMRDMQKKGREHKASGEQHGSKTQPHQTPRGKSHGMSKLNEDVVREIRATYVRGKTLQRDLAKRFGVVQTIISRVIRRETWAHVP